MTRKRYQALATLIDAITNCAKTGNIEWEQKHTDRLNQLGHMSGAGIDLTIDTNRSTPNKLILDLNYTSYDDVGYCRGTTSHTVVVTPSLAYGIDLRITPISHLRRLHVDDYLYDVIDTWLRESVDL